MTIPLNKREQKMYDALQIALKYLTGRTIEKHAYQELLGLIRDVLAEVEGCPRPGGGQWDIEYKSMKVKKQKECPMCGGPMEFDDLFACAKCRKRLEKGEK